MKKQAKDVHMTEWVPECEWYTELAHNLSYLMVPVLFWATKINLTTKLSNSNRAREPMRQISTVRKELSISQYHTPKIGNKKPVKYTHVHIV